MIGAERAERADEAATPSARTSTARTSTARTSTARTSTGRRGWASWAGAVLFLLALSLRLGAAVGDLPHIYDWDEPLFVTFDIGPLWTGSTIEPAEFHHPAVYKEVSAAVLAGGSVLTGWEGQDLRVTAGLIGDRTVANPMPWVSVRILVAVLGAAAVALCWDAGRRFGLPDWASAVAGFFGAVAPLLISIAPRIASDGYLVFFVMVAVWALAWTLQRPSLGRQALLGVALGLIVATKYTAAPLVVIALAAPWVALRSKARSLIWLAVAGASALAAFLVTNPYIPARFDQFYDEMQTQNFVYQSGLVGLTGRPIRFNLHVLLENAGPLAVLAVGVIPLWVLTRNRTEPWRRWARRADVTGVVMLTVGIVAWVLFQARYDVRISRNVMPLILPVCLLGGLALPKAYEVVRRRGTTALGIATIVLSLGAGLQCAKGAFEFGKAVADERGDARSWLQANVEPGDVVMGEFGAPYVGADGVTQEEVAFLSDVDLDDLRSGRIDWLVSSSESTGVVFSDQARWAEQIADYQERFSAVCDWHSFRSWNTEVRVGRVCASQQSDMSSERVGG